MRYQLLLFPAAAIAAFAVWLSSTDTTAESARSKTRLITTPAYNLKKLTAKSSVAKIFVAKNGYNTQICFLIDMSIPSGQPRFFVYDLKKDSVINAGLVTHGRCNENWLEGRKYGNTVGCGCTSLGKYKIGYPYNGRFGLAFKLYGLESTNSKAFERFVVLHAHDCVPETTTTDEICQSDGCPTVSPGFLQQLKPMINHSGKPVLLWIFD
ncbi:MAG: murein L,D-transpeptidase catalytic domain family protein [Chitinophagaceae bacterium]|nr:murein L,D-transpeptidase catalytic domain family protein [Chitinophagaceae bacterium]